MRSDMAKVIVERPRLRGGAWTKPKGYRKLLNREGVDRACKEAMKRPWKNHTKFFNEHLGPLRRYLAAQVGRPWDKVFSEICANISCDSAVQSHVRDHVMDYVAVNVGLIDGVLCYLGGPRGWGQTGTPLTELRGTLFYVCPRSGLLRKLKRVRRVPPAKGEEPRYIRLDKTHQCQWFNGAWYLVTLRPLPGDLVDVPEWNPPTILDEVLGRRLSRKQAIEIYGTAVYGISGRRLGKREMRQYPIPIDWQK
jgi:hypothetical protein